LQEAFSLFEEALDLFDNEKRLLPPKTHVRYTRSHVTPSEFLEKWSGSAAAERSNAQSFVIDLCAVLKVDPPHAATSDADRDAYVFEKPVTVPHEGRQHSIGFIDLFKRGHFILEAKQGSDETAPASAPPSAASPLGTSPCRTLSVRRSSTPAPWTRRRRSSS
jgi:hypothetical protein